MAGRRLPKYGGNFGGNANPRHLTLHEPERMDAQEMKDEGEPGHGSDPKAPKGLKLPKKNRKLRLGQSYTN